MEDSIVELLSFISKFVDSGEQMGVRAERYGIQMLAAFSIVAVLLRLAILLLQDSAGGELQATRELLLNIGLVSFMVSFFYVYADVYTASVGWTVGIGISLLGADVGSNIYWDTVGRLFSVATLMVAESINIDWSWNLLAVMGDIVGDLIKALLSMIYLLLVLWLAITMVMILAIIELTSAAVYPLGVFCIPFGVFVYPWANSVFMAWIRLALFTLFARLIFYLMVGITEDYLDRFTIENLDLGRNGELNFIEILGIFLFTLIYGGSLSLALKIAQEITGGGGGFSAIGGAVTGGAVAGGMASTGRGVGVGMASAGRGVASAFRKFSGPKP